MIKYLLKLIVYQLVTIRSYLYIKYYYIKNSGREKILIYTDSRGFEISKIKNRKSPFESYINYFIKNYQCTVYICPEKHTTFFDFFFEIRKLYNVDYNYIICHVGVVDFSPRNINDVKNILNKKSKKIKSMYGNEFFMSLCNTHSYGIKFQGFDTASIIHISKAKFIVNELNKIKTNLIWISCNPVLSCWDGNYKGKRPENINIVNEVSKYVLSKLSEDISYIDLTNLKKDEVMLYTCDNIHLSKSGMELLEDKIKYHLKC